ncbi:MAG: hypothetical protein JNG83_09505 [Opitutaceae bacterium]|nr:hypothetical protein [Opitutaceae bacterium]
MKKNQAKQSAAAPRAGWKRVLTLDRQRRVVAGSPRALADAVRRGADLRIGTEFRHNEHIDPSSDNPELVREVSDFRVTYLLEDRWVAGIMNLRHPIALPDGFGERPSLSLFLYNQDGSQAIARPFLDGRPARGRLGPSPLADHRDMPKYRQEDAWDGGTNAPSSNFVYEFDNYVFWVRDDWQEVLAHDEFGTVRAGSVDRLAREFTRGREVKVGIAGLCADMAVEPTPAHEVFVQCGSGYYYTRQRRFMAAAQPVVRVRPAVPLRYRSNGWDYGWLMPRTDGHVARWLVDPYTLKYDRAKGRHALRWFVR